MFLAALLLFPTISTAQCDSADQRFAGIYQIGSGGTIVNPSWRFAGFQYIMPSDSCEVEFNYAEAYQNTERLIWQNWCKDSLHTSWEDSTHALMSRTRPITLHTGDTIRIFRSMGWVNPATGYALHNAYSALDTIGFAVELIDTATHQRVALLDSIRIDARYSPGTPAMHAAPVNTPIARAIRYGVHAGLNNSVVYLRVAPTVRGIGTNYLVRRDIAFTHPSRQLCLSKYLRYLATSLGFPLDTSNCLPSSAPSDSTLTASLFAPDTAGLTVHIEYRGAGNNRLTTLAVVPVVNGTPVLDTISLPVESQSVAGLGSLNYTLPSFGEYLLLLQHNRVRIAAIRFALDSTGYAQIN